MFCAGGVDPSSSLFQFVMDRGGAFTLDSSLLDVPHDRRWDIGSEASVGVLFVGLTGPNNAVGGLAYLNFLIHCNTWIRVLVDTFP